MRVEEWLWALLRYDATLQGLVGGRVYAYAAPEGATLPAVVFQHQAATDVRTGPGQDRIMVDGLWLVRGVSEGRSFAQLRPVADRIDTLLSGASGTVSDALVLHTVREEPAVLVERQAGIEYRHLGGLYRIWSQAA